LWYFSANRCVCMHTHYITCINGSQLPSKDPKSKLSYLVFPCQVGVVYLGRGGGQNEGKAVNGVCVFVGVHVRILEFRCSNQPPVGCPRSYNISAFTHRTSVLCVYTHAFVRVCACVCVWACICGKLGFKYMSNLHFAVIVFWSIETKCIKICTCVKNNSFKYLFGRWSTDSLICKL